jgi:hypothetical protein
MPQDLESERIEMLWGNSVLAKVTINAARSLALCAQSGSYNIVITNARFKLITAANKSKVNGKSSD